MMATHGMGRHRSVLLLGFLLLALPSFAQTAKQEPIETPVAPAFIILGVNPTTIARPTTPRALAVEALSLVSASQSGVPQTYALQVAPYWLQSHPKLTFSDYISAPLGKSLLHNLTFSFATTPESDLTTDSAPGLGLGVRSMWFVGLDVTQIQKKADELKQVQNENNVLAQEVEDAQDLIESKGGETGMRQQILEVQRRLDTAEFLAKQLEAESGVLTTQIGAAAGDARVALEREKARLDERQKVMNTYLDAEKKKLKDAQEELKKLKDAQDVVAGADAKADNIKKRMEALAKEIQAMLPRRGLALEAALAMGIALPADGRRPAEVARLGGWLTASYRAVEGIELLGLLRVLENDVETERVSRFVDYGGRLVVRVSTLTLSGEIVRRTVHRNKEGLVDSTRFAGMLEIPASNDVKFNLTVAKEFNSRELTSNALVGVLGVTFQFGSPPPVSP